MISESVKSALTVLGCQDVPRTMKEVQDRFLQLRLQRHPDKVGSTEEFQQLLEAKKVWTSERQLKLRKAK